MRNLALLLIVFALMSCANQSVKQTNENKDLAIETQSSYEVEKLSGIFKFTEGPAADAQGNVYFADIPNHLIYVWTTDDMLDTFRVKSGRANGLFFDKDENLLVCEGELGQITATSAEREYKVVASSYDGSRFNQPNDLWPDNKGGIYFTDPKYGKDDTVLNQDGMHVYYITPNYSEVIRVIDDFEKPNGVLGTPDGNTLYVTDAQAAKTYKYDIMKDGSLANKTLFVELGCDGMTIDNLGNVYLTPRGKHNVEIYSPSAQLLDSIVVPERPSNVCFGGKNNDYLFITARTSIYRVKLKDLSGVD